MDEILGLRYPRVPTWCPFRLQFYCNGHSWLARKLTAAGIDFSLAGNASFDAALAASLANILESPTRESGIDVGSRAAERMLAARQRDGVAAKVAYTPGSGAADWCPTPPAFAAAVLPHWGMVKPSLLTSIDYIIELSVNHDITKAWSAPNKPQ